MSTLILEPTKPAAKPIESAESPEIGSPDIESLGVTSLSQYVKMQNCDRFLRFRLAAHEDRALRAKWNVEIQPLTPLLRESGQVFEEAVEAQLAQSGEQVINLGENSENDISQNDMTLDWLRKASKPVILLQPAIGGQMGRYSYTGVADVVRLHRDKKKRLHIYIGDIKASRVERTEHRLQVAAYAYLLRGMADAAGIKIESMRGGVLTLQDDGSIPELDPDNYFDLDTYITILHHVAIDDDCVVNQVAAKKFDEIDYHLGRHCDGCMYNGLCMHDSAERMDLSLVPYISATEKRTLLEHGVTDLPQLAGLMDLEFGDKEAGTRTKLSPSPTGAEKVQELSNIWPVGANLSVLIQRAKRAAKRFDRETPALTYMLSGGYGTLPDPAEHPNLIRVFFDAQHDYLRDRLYLISALVVGPNGEKTVVAMADAPPTDAMERDLLINWIGGVLHAVGTVADNDGASDEAVLHLYCYSPTDQKILLEALKRHLEQVALLPGFFDLMTQSAALNQPMISFLAKEIETRRNLGTVCGTLHDVARQLGFDWGEHRTRFRRGVFDNQRGMMRADDGTILPVPKDANRDELVTFPIESASRFGSQMPLEYAYAIWGKLPIDGPNERLLASFRQVTQDQLLGFAEERSRALAHIENSFLVRARGLHKQPLNLDALRRKNQPAATLAQSMREFLFMEHHAALQAKLQTYSLPVVQRVATGLALLLKYKKGENEKEYEKEKERESKGSIYRFDVAFREIGLDPVLTMNGLRLKEGSWVVLNTLYTEEGAPLTANRIKHGRLATIHAVGNGKEGNSWVELQLMTLSFWKGSFRYVHDAKLQPLPDELYMLDEMADDMNGDKLLAGLVHAEENVLYQWLLDQPAARNLSTDVVKRSDDFAKVVDTIEAPFSMTKAQRGVVSNRIDEPLLLVQGPPGTGKSHTLGWAVINRILAAIAVGKPCRVAVTCKTHNAVNIVMESIAKKWRKLAGFPLPMLGKGGLPQLEMVRLVNSSDGSESVPDGVEALHAFSAGQQRLEHLINQSFVVVGGTPGGLFNLARYREAGGKQIDWDLKSFELVIIDEASQMSLPEGVLACSMLRPEGSVMVVGDHRQMPPIVVHEWENEERRSLVESQPYLSLFEYLLDRGFAKASLDQSFRLHEQIAQFLNENIYKHDGIYFYSKRTDLLIPPLVDPASQMAHFVETVMDPAYPIVVIEHDEASSQQYNETELAIVAPLIECAQAMRLDGADGIGVVVPHRAQKTLLRERFPALAAAESIDTVERFQGGERDVIIVSATASDPDYVLAEAEFLLNLNRLNVALSRARMKLIVVASRSVTKLLISELDTFEQAIIWKRLYFQYARETLWEGEVDGAEVWVRGCGR